MPKSELFEKDLLPLLGTLCFLYEKIGKHSDAPALCADGRCCLGAGKPMA